MTGTTILVTGADGFAGRHLIRALSAKGYSIVAATGKDVSLDDELHSLCDTVLALDLAKQNEIPHNKKIDNIIHLASLTPHMARRQSIDDQEMQRINHAINHSISHLVQTLNPTRTLLVSSCAVYEPTGQIMTEYSPLKQSPDSYATTKIELEMVASELVSSGHETVIARPFNHIGPSQPLGFIVPDIIDKLRNDSSSIELGYMGSDRDYVDARDIATAYVNIIESDGVKSGDIFNISSGRATSGEMIFETITKHMQCTPKVVPKVSPISPRYDLIVGSSQAIRNTTGWNPTHSLDKSIRDYIDNLSF